MSDNCSFGVSDKYIRWLKGIGVCCRDVLVDVLDDTLIDVLGDVLIDVFDDTFDGIQLEDTLRETLTLSPTNSK
jgi:hypothetical protein